MYFPVIKCLLLMRHLMYFPVTGKYIKCLIKCKIQYILCTRDGLLYNNCVLQCNFYAITGVTCYLLRWQVIHKNREQ